MCKILSSSVSHVFVQFVKAYACCKIEGKSSTKQHQLLANFCKQHSQQQQQQQQHYRPRQNIYLNLADIFAYELSAQSPTHTRATTARHQREKCYSLSYLCVQGVVFHIERLTVVMYA